MELKVGDYVYLKVSLMHGVTRFGIKGKLTPRYIGPFEIVEKISDVAYRLDLPPHLGHVHDVPCVHAKEVHTLLVAHLALCRDSFTAIRDL